MADTSVIAGGPSLPNNNSFRPKCGATFPVGTPLRVLSGLAVQAAKTNITTAATVGFASSPGVAGSVNHDTFVTTQYVGPLKLSLDQWSAVNSDADIVGLVAGEYYYLGNAGFITTVRTNTSGQVAIRLGLAIANDTLMIQIGDAFQQ